MQLVDWNDYQAFLAIARAGQLARAAAAMGVDATTVGRRLRRLEARLGMTLFEQTREGQILTEAGETLLATVEQMALAASNIGESAEKGGLSGTLRISVSEGFGTWFLAERLPEFAKAHPGLTLDLVARSGFLSPSKREADLAVVLSRPKAGPVICQKLSDYTLRLYASRIYLERRGTPISPADLAIDHVLVGYVPDLLYSPELDYLDEFHAGLTARIRSSSINAQHRLIAADAGIGVLPCFIGDQSDGLATVCPDRTINRSFWIVTHRDTQNLARVRALKEWLRACVAQGRERLHGIEQSGPQYPSIDRST